MADYHLSHDVSDNDVWQSQDYLQMFNSDVRLTPPSPVASTIFSIETSNETFSEIQSVTTPKSRNIPHSRRLLTVPTSDRGSEEIDIEGLPHYRVEWKVKLKRQILWENTERNVVIPPMNLWQSTLKPRIDEVLQTKVPHNWCVKPESTKVVVSVNKHAVKNVIFGFTELQIDWTMVTDHLRLWREYFLEGKIIRVILILTYMETGGQSARHFSKGNKRGAMSTTDLMLAERDLHLERERATTDKPRVWPDVYRTLRCPGGSCENRKHCWIDSAGVHHPLRTERLNEIVEWVQDDHELTCHADMPDHIQKKILEEEEIQNSERKKRRRVAASPNVAPININVLPGQQATVSQLQGETAVTALSAISPATSEMDDPSLLDTLIPEYTEYQKSRVGSSSRKRDIENVGKAVENGGWDLKLLRKSQHHEALYGNSDLKKGTVARYLEDIEPWLERRKRQR